MKVELSWQARGIPGLIERLVDPAQRNPAGALDNLDRGQRARREQRPDLGDPVLEHVGDPISGRPRGEPRPHRQ
jgi:hypothetical protein